MDYENKVLEVLNKQLDGFICPNQTELYNLDTKKLFQAIHNLEEKGVLRKRDCEGLAYEYDTYGCDGKNENCQQAILWKNAHWFTASLGFCNHCWERIHENLSDDELTELYDACEAGDEEAVKKIIKATV